MRKIKFLIPIVTLLIVIFSCSDDDDNGIIIIPPLERSDEVIVAKEEVEEYLETHFYNYEEFENFIRRHSMDDKIIAKITKCNLFISTRSGDRGRRLCLPKSPSGTD